MRTANTYKLNAAIIIMLFGCAMIAILSLAFVSPGFARFVNFILHV